MLLWEGRGKKVTDLLRDGRNGSQKLTSWSGQEEVTNNFFSRTHRVVISVCNEGEGLFQKLLCSKTVGRKMKFENKLLIHVRAAMKKYKRRGEILDI